LSGWCSIIGTLTIIDDVSEHLTSEAVLRKQIPRRSGSRVTRPKRHCGRRTNSCRSCRTEIRSPLNAVMGWARILLTRDTVDQELVKRGMQVIRAQREGAAKMIDDMLDMARIVAGKLRLEMQPVDLLSVILSAVDGIMPSANAKQIAVRTKLDYPTLRRACLATRIDCSR
jgi:K+-sensing histidine kinase KdpD